MSAALHFAAVGVGEPALVFTHGLAASGASWRAQVAHFAPRHRVVTWDLRGHGGSPSPAGDCGLSDLAGDLRAVLDAAGLARAVVVGHSAGGVVAMQLALDHPERVAGLVLVGTASECNEKARDLYVGLAAIAETEGMEKVYRRLGISAEAASAAPAEPRGFARVARAMASLHDVPLTPRLDAIRCPTLILVGEKDFLGAGGSVILSRRIAGARLHIIPERGHGLFREDPAGFNRLVEDFLAAQYAPSDSAR